MMCDTTGRERSDRGNDDGANERLAGATDPVLDRGGSTGAEAKRDHSPYAGEVQRADLHGMAVPAREEGPRPEVRVHPTGDDPLRHRVESNTEDIRGGRIIFPVREVVRHNKRGTIYSVIAEATLQSDDPRLDGSRLVIYVGEAGHVNARFPNEFDDGRFTKV